MAKIKTTGENVIEEVNSDTSVTSGGLTVNIGKNYDNFNNTIADIQNMSMFAQRGHEAFMINKKTHSSIAIRQNGQINLAADFYAQYKINPGGKITEQSLESTVITNRRSVIADDVLINEHKLNPYLYELTDMKKLETPYNDNVIVGNLCMAGSVLVKAWEPDLHRYVLMRRPVRLPVFSPLLNVPEINEGLGVTDPLKIDEQILAKSTKGYHGNAVQTDAKSLIGKEGFNRAGVDAGSLTSIGSNATGAAASDGAGIPDAVRAMPGANDPFPVGDVSAANPHYDMANAVGHAVNISPCVLWIQWSHETGYFNSDLCTKFHNYGGMKLGVDTSEKWGVYGRDSIGHAYFRSDEDFVRYASWYYTQWDDVGLRQTKTYAEWCHALKLGGYYEDLETNYVAGMLSNAQFLRT